MIECPFGQGVGRRLALGVLRWGGRGKDTVVERGMQVSNVREGPGIDKAGREEMVMLAPRD